MTKQILMGCIAYLVAISSGFGQYPDVHEENYHKPIFEWTCFRYLNVYAHPGDTTGWHIHRNPILYLTISGAEVWLDAYGSAPRVSKLPTAWIGSDAYSGGDTLLHRFAVKGDTPLHIVAIEQIGTCDAVPHPKNEPVYEGSGFSVYAIDWGTYMTGEFFTWAPAIVAPVDLQREDWINYGAGYLLKPAPHGLQPAPGAEMLWMVLPSKR